MSESIPNMETPVSHSDLKYALGRLDAKVDILLSGKTATDDVLKDVSKRLQALEVEVATLKTEKTTTKQNAGTLWAVVTAVGALALSAWQAFAGH